MDTYRSIEWVRYDARTTFFTYALQYLNWECVEGDLLEFGVSVGKSLALIALLYRENLALWQYTEPAVTKRRIGGYDSFSGLPAGEQAHPRWKPGSFATNYLAGHPSLTFNQKITPDSIHRLFDACGLIRPELEEGWFAGEKLLGRAGCGQEEERCGNEGAKLPNDSSPDLVWIPHGWMMN